MSDRDRELLEMLKLTKWIHDLETGCSQLAINNQTVIRDIKHRLWDLLKEVAK